MKWKELKAKFAEEVTDSENISTAINGVDDETFRRWLLVLLFEIHGDLDQIALAQRESVKHATEILECWRAVEARAEKNDQRASESHPSTMIALRLAIAREERMKQIDDDNAARLAELRAKFPKITKTPSNAEAD